LNFGLRLEIYQSSLRVNLGVIFSVQMRTLNDYPIFEKESEIIDRTNSFVRFNPEDNEMEELMDFPTKIGKVKYGTGQGTRALNDLITAQYNNDLIFLNHTQTYLVKLYDMKTDRLVCVFKRDYKRIRPF
jgi:hypothetical protein